MGLLSELRYPTTRRAKLITATLALIFFTLLATATISGFLLYRVVSPAPTGSELDPANLLGRPGVVSFPVPGEEAREGWFFPGQKKAPTIILCHGYKAHRTELLTLAIALQEHQFNVFLFDFSGHGKSGRYTTLGYRETKELLAAVEAVAQRDDIDRSRFGVWGANLGGYAAVAAAAADSRIRAVAVDSVYDEPAQMMLLEVDRSGLTVLPLVSAFCRVGYKLLNFPHRNDAPLSQRVAGLAGVAKLFIQAREAPALAESTLQVFLRSPEPRQQWIVQKANYGGMMDEEKRVYENHLLSFFLQALPPAGARPR